MDTRKQIIIPDIHGREFWREAVKGIDGETHVVFLGDYLDPYEDDRIDWSDAFNRLMFTEDFVEALADISWRRGGSSPVGSMVWADIYEYGLSRPIAADVVQICGHTRLPEGKPKEMEHIWCLDCQRAFILTADGLR